MPSPRSMRNFLRWIPWTPANNSHRHAQNTLQDNMKHWNGGWSVCFDDETYFQLKPFYLNCKNNHPASTLDTVPSTVRMNRYFMWTISSLWFSHLYLILWTNQHQICVAYHPCYFLKEWSYLILERSIVWTNFIDDFSTINKCDKTNTWHAFLCRM